MALNHFSARYYEPKSEDSPVEIFFSEKINYKKFCSIRNRIFAIGGIAACKFWRQTYFC